MDMETEQYYEDVFAYNEMVEGDQSYSQGKSYAPAPETVSNDYNGGYDCNICFDHARDPVVTLCGHLYCWPCIYKWLHTETTSFITPEEQHKSQCPVCKADVWDTTLVSLYGRGGLSSEREFSSKDFSDIEIPRRPPAYGVHALVTNPNQQFHSRPYNVRTHFPTEQNQQYYPQNYSAASPFINLGGLTNHPMMSMFGEMAYARVFGNSTEVNLIGYRNSYNHLRGSSARGRRQEMKAEKSLNRFMVAGREVTFSELSLSFLWAFVVVAIYGGSHEIIGRERVKLFSSTLLMDMETEQYYEDLFPYNEMVEGDQAYSQGKSYAPAPETVSNDYNGGYDCNICFDHARDPVVTLCGHFYCWPCMYKWLHTESTSFITPEEQHKSQCPVCKADVWDTTLVPLYGRGGLSSKRELNSKDSSDIDIPHGPPAYGVHSLVTNPNQQFHSRPYNVHTHFPTNQNPQYYPQNYSVASPIINLGGITNHPMTSMFGEMAYARVFGNSTEVNLIGYQNSYHHLRGSSARNHLTEYQFSYSVALFCACYCSK